MRMRTIEISVGAFVLAGVLGLVFLAVQVSGINLTQADDTYVVFARFDDVAGLRPRAKVSMAGVTIGRVQAIEVDLTYGEAVVTLEIEGQPGTLNHRHRGENPDRRYSGGPLHQFAAWC